MTPRTIDGHRRAFTLLLRVYPRWFRDAYGEEMAILFGRRLERAREEGGVVRLWWRTTKDALATAVALRRPGRGEQRSHGNDGRGMGMDTLWQDVRYAVRHLTRAPVFTLGAVGLLAVGMGANTAVFTMVDALLFRPPPWQNPEAVVHVYQDSDEGDPSSSSYPATRDMAASPVFAAVAAISPSSAALEGSEGAVQVATEYTTASYLTVLGLAPLRGSWFGPEHDVAGGPPAAVVSAVAWRSRFGADPGIVGRAIRLNGQVVTVVGVGPEDLLGTYPPMVTDFWLSISATVVGGPFQVANLERRQDHWYDVRARLAPGASVEQAQAAMNALATRLAEEYPELNRGRDITVFPSADVRLHPGEDGGLFLAGGLLSALVLTVLLLACANLANLLLVRGLGRSGEMAVRTALGAPGVRVARLFLTESVLLAFLGGMGGVLIARWILSAVPSMPIPIPMGSAMSLEMDARVGLFSLALVAATGLLFGLAPALRAVRADVAQTLRDDGRNSSVGRGTARLRNLLVVVQVATSLVLVLGTALFARSLGALQGVDTGMDVDRLAFVRVNWNGAGLSGEEGVAAVEDLVARVTAIPGVSGAAAASRLPAQRAGSTTTEVEGYTPAAGTGAVELDFSMITDGYFQASGIPLLEGRAFGDDDVRGAEEVSVILNQAAVDRFWPGQAPLGRRLRGQGSETWTRRVVGVVGNAPVVGLGEAPRPLMYFSHRQVGGPPAYLVARVDGDPASVVNAIRQGVTGARQTLSVSAQGTLSDHLGATLAAPRLVAWLMGAFSALALILAGLGIYAVVSFSVARRTAELGIRMALGAHRGRLVSMVVREVVGVVGAGVVIGVGVSALAASRLESLIYGVGALDPVSFGGAVAVLVLVGWAAAYLPARRAALADPVEALRTQ